MKRAMAVAFVLAVVAGGQVQTQGPTVDQVLDKWLTAAGGRAAFEKLTSRVASGTIEIPEASVTGTISITEKAPDKLLVVVEIAAIGSIREGTDGVIAWEQSPMEGLKTKEGAELAEAKRGAAFHPELNLKKVYPNLEVVGREPINGRPAVVLRSTPPDSTPVTFFFDAESGLLVRQSLRQTTSQGPIDFDVYLEDYRTVDGVKQAFLVRQVTSQFTNMVRITDMKHNVQIDDVVFRKPGL